MSRHIMVKITAIAVAAMALVGGVQAQEAPKNYFFLKAIPALKPKGGEAPPAPPSITLEPAVLPAGMEGVEYSYDLKALTTTTGGKAGDATVFRLADESGSLPAGISLSSDGLLAGKPTAVTPDAGSSFTVVGTYVTASGQQVYTIKVGESLLNATRIDAGNSHSCALTPVGGVKCWGYNSNGQLGDGSKTSSNVPVQVVGLNSGVLDISVGGNVSCVVTTTGAAKCWGENFFMNLGDGTTNSSSVPVQVQGLTTGVSSISVGDIHTCAIVYGAAKCWGYNGSGQLGDGTTNDSSFPVQVFGLTAGVSSVSAGNAHTCALVYGSAKCWGANGSRQLGNTAVQSMASSPRQVSGLTAGVNSISAGAEHTCAVVFGAAKCWGGNNYGNLGNGTTTSSSVPVQVSGLTSGVSSISAVGPHACAVVSGAAKCWGMNTTGRLGNGTTTNSSIPVTVKAGN